MNILERSCNARLCVYSEWECTTSYPAWRRAVGKSLTIVNVMKWTVRRWMKLGGMDTHGTRESETRQENDAPIKLL